MRRFKVFSGYQQFYVADVGLDPKAPEVWTDEHIAQRHHTQRHITALCPAGDISARIISCGLGENVPEESNKSDFEIRTHIEVLSGKIGIFGWPWELQDQYEVAPGMYDIVFKGYQTDRVEEKEDFYVVKIEKA